MLQLLRGGAYSDLTPLSNLQLAPKYLSPRPSGIGLEPGKHR
jgi:hypothetical protein